MKSITAKLHGVALFFLAIMFSSCISSEGERQGYVAFAHVEGQEWHLFEIRRGAETARMNRGELEAAGFIGVYTITFEDGMVSGMGAPNRFFGPYTVGSAAGELSIGLLGHTLMAAIFEPEGLREHEYFNYLSGVTRWQLYEGRLKLFASSNDGSEAVLVFVLDK